MQKWSMDEDTGDITDVQGTYRYGTMEHVNTTITAYNYFKRGLDANAFNELMIMHLLCIRMYLCSDDALTYVTVRIYSNTYRYMHATPIHEELYKLHKYTLDMKIGEYIRISYRVFNSVLITAPVLTYGDLAYCHTVVNIYRYTEPPERPALCLGSFVKSYVKYSLFYAVSNTDKQFNLLSYVTYGTNLIGDKEYMGVIPSDVQYNLVHYRDSREYNIFIFRSYFNFNSYKHAELTYEQIFNTMERRAETWCQLYVNTNVFPRVFLYDRDDKIITNPQMMHVTFVHALGNRFDLNLHTMLYMLGVMSNYPPFREGMSPENIEFIKLFDMIEAERITLIVPALYDALIKDKKDLNLIDMRYQVGFLYIRDIRDKVIEMNGGIESLLPPTSLGLSLYR